MNLEYKIPLNTVSSHDLFLLLQADEQYNNDVTEEIISRIQSGQAFFKSDLFGCYPTPETEVGIAAVAISRRTTFAGGRFVRPITHIADCFTVFAGNHNCWYDESYLRSNSTVQFRSGTESVVYVKGNDVFKLTSARDNYQDILLSDVLDGIICFGECFPYTAYKIIGFGHKYDGTFGIVTKQPRVAGRTIAEMAKREHGGDESWAILECDRAMLACGFIKDGATWLRPDRKYRITDISPENVMVDKDGEYFIIDADVHPAAAGYLSDELFLENV